MTLSGGALETTQLLIQGILQGLSDKTVTTTQAAQMLTQLLKLKFTGEDLKTVFSNTSIGVTATDLDMRDLSQATDTIQVFQPDPSQAKFLMYGNTAKDGTGIFYVPKLDTDGHLQIDVLTLPAITGAVTSNSGTGWADSGIAKETGGNLADVKIAVEAYTYTPNFATSTLSDTTVWYAYSIPADTVELSITARTGYDFYVSKDSNGATYEKIWAGDSFKVEHVRNTKVTGTIYLKSPDKAGLILQIRSLVRN